MELPASDPEKTPRGPAFAPGLAASEAFLTVAAVALADYRYGGMTIIEDAKERDYINVLLRGIDPDLFLERQVTPTGERVWCVVQQLGGDEVPVTVYEARGPDGTPLPYPTESIVETFRRRAAENLTMQDRIAIADRRNDELRQMHADTAAEHYRDIARDFKRLATTLPCLPRRKSASGAGARQQATNDLERRLGLR